EARHRVEVVGPHDETPPHCHSQADDEEQPEQVEHCLVEEVEIALEKLVTEERDRDVVIDGGQHGSHEERKEAPEHGGVHDARVRLRQRAGLTEGVDRDELQALGDVVNAALRLTGAPQPHPLPHPVREDDDRDDRSDVQSDLSPDRNVPERVTERDLGHEGLNDSTARTAWAAEYGSISSSATR